jgi:dTDP-4-dehydrorhamnose 3,5-epimerase
VRHGLKAGDAEFAGFGEAYFSSVDQGAVKGWKRHNRMTLNLIVVLGEVRFIVLDETSGERWAFQPGPDGSDGYGRLTVPPGLWMAFGGAGPGQNLLLNLASIEHDPAEADARPLDEFAWRWAEAPSHRA